MESFSIRGFILGSDYNRSGMDPDRYQARDLKRRVTSLEKSQLRADIRIRGLMQKVGEAHDAIQILRAIALHLEERTS